MNERLRINLSWLRTLRWAAVVGQLVTVLTAAWGLNADLPLVPLFGLIGLTAVSNLAFLVWYRHQERSRSRSDAIQAGHRLVDGLMTMDLCTLSALLYLTGGAANPFSVFFLVNLALAAVVVVTPWIWTLGLLSIVSFCVLCVWYRPLELLTDPKLTSSFFGAVTVYREGQMVAFTAAACAIAYFTARLTRELRERDQALLTARQRQARNEKLESLATLAAGAAHELATPLSTIAVVARELERNLEKLQAAGECIEDARLIRTELAQCRTILDRMAGRAGEAVGEGPGEFTVVELIEETLAGLPNIQRIELHHLSDPPAKLNLPKVALGQALRGLVKNALDVGGRDGRVRVQSRTTGDRVHIQIQDFGPGMSVETLQRAGEPFFTTKQPGEGTGLGLFLAKAVIDRLEGTFQIRSEVNVGTTVDVVLPRLPDPADA